MKNIEMLFEAMNGSNVDIDLTLCTMVFKNGSKRAIVSADKDYKANKMLGFKVTVIDADGEQYGHFESMADAMNWFKTL